MAFAGKISKKNGGSAYDKHGDNTHDEPMGSEPEDIPMGYVPSGYD